MLEQMPENPHAEHLQELLEGLNEPQREAVTHGEGPLLILAGAGSGKTRVLTHRLAFLIYTDQAQAGEILAITFTNKAAKEMRERVERLLGHSTRGMWLMTFHAACARILRAEAERLGYTRQFTIYDQADARRLTKRCMDAVGRRPQALHAGGDPQPDLLRQEQAQRRRRLQPGGRLAIRGAGRRGVHAVRARPDAHERDGLRRPAVSHRQPAGALPRGARALQRKLPPRAGRRVPGHQPRAVPLPAAAGRRRAPGAGARGSPSTLGGPSQPRRGRRRRAVDLQLPQRRHPQPPRLPGGLPRRARGEARAELPLHRDDPEGRQRGDRQQPRRDRQAPVERARRRRADPGARARGRARRGALRGGRDRAARSTRAPRARRSPCCTAPTRCRACSRTRSCAARSPTR